MANLDLRALVDTYAAVASSMDIDAYANLFAEDCTRIDPVGQPGQYTRTEVRASWAGVVASAVGLRFEVADVHCVLDTAAFHFDVTVDLGGATAKVSGIEVMVFNDAGLIESMHAYWGDTDFSLE
jgi:steroid delta-isomerase